MEIDKNDSLSIKLKEEIHTFHYSRDLLISSILNNNINYNNNIYICRKLFRDSLWLKQKVKSEIFSKGERKMSVA